MPRLVQAGIATAARRRAYFHIVLSDGVSPALAEVGGQPQLSTDGGAWTNTGVGVLVAIGFGRYYADLTTGAVATSGTAIETRYKGTLTAETPGDSFQVVAFDPANIAASILSAPLNLVVTDSAGAIKLPSPAPTGYGTGGTVVLDSGAAGSGGSATIFTATGASLHAPTNGYTGQNLEFTSGVLQGQRRTITTHTVSGSTHTLAFTIGFTSAPGSGDTFIIA